MAETVAEMTRDELKQMIADVIEEKLQAILDEQDDDGELLQTMRERLLQQKEAVARGEYGRPLDDVVRNLGLD